jgi:hypothetical protein
MSEYPCPQCGQDLRLPADILEQLSKAWKLANALEARLEALAHPTPEAGAR